MKTPRFLFAGWTAALAVALPAAAVAQTPAPAPAPASAPALAVTGTGPARSISFNEAIQIALEQNGSLRLAENTAELSDVQVRQAKSQFIPDLRFSTSTSEAIGRNFSQDEGRILNTTTHSVNAGVSSSLTLFNGFANTGNLQVARLSQQASQSDLNRTKETVVFTVMSNYLTLIAAREQLGVLQESLAAQEALEGEIQKSVTAGIRSISDLYQQQASVASARLALVQGQRSVAVAEMSLIQTLQLDPTQNYDFQAPELSTVPAGSRDFELQQMTQQALAKRADVAASESRVESADRSVKVASATRWPSISLSAGYNSGFNSAGAAGFFDQFDQRRGGSLGLNFSLPIFDRFSSSTNTQRAKVQAENARINLENARQQVAVEVRRAVLDYQSAEAQLQASEAQLRAANLALQTSQQRYDVGAATLVELTQARATQVQAASNLVNARYSLVFQGRLMDYYLGNNPAPEAAQ
jgi:outer membrane protein